MRSERDSFHISRLESQFDVRSCLFHCNLVIAEIFLDE